MEKVLIWLLGALAAIIAGASNAVLAVWVAPDTFNFDSGFSKVCQMALGGAVIGLAGYLKQSPIPQKEQR